LTSGATIFQTLQLPVQTAVEAIAGYNAKANNLSQAEISAIQKQASVISASRGQPHADEVAHLGGERRTSSDSRLSIRGVVRPR